MAAIWCMARGDRERLAGRYERAARQIQRGLVLLRNGGPLGEACRARLLNRLGMVYKYQGRLGLSGRAYCRAFRIATKLFPEDHSLLATHYHNLAGLEHARGRYAEAEPLARHGLAIRERVVGPKHPAVGRDLAALAAIVDGNGRHEEAEALHRRALEILSRHRRSERREIAYATGNLAACLRFLNRLDEAEVLGRRAMDLQLKALGSRHPDLAVSRDNLAAIRSASDAAPSPESPEDLPPM